jgi:hypothetical protein
MKNVDRLAKYITKNGPNGILIHTVPRTNNWIICQKIEIDKWLMTLCNPGGNVTYNLGTVNDAQHLQLWAEITKMEIENKTSQILLRQELKDKINNFKKQYEQNFQNFKKAINISDSDEKNRKSRKEVQSKIQQKRSKKRNRINSKTSKK